MFNCRHIVILLFIVLISGCAIMPDTKYSPLNTRELNSDWLRNDEGYKYYRGLVRARKFAQYVSIYSVAAYDAYGDDLQLVECIPFPLTEKWVPLLPEEGSGYPDGIDEKIGFAAKAWLRNKSDSAREIVISFRGTDDFWKDFTKGNLVFSRVLFGKTQFDAALEYTREILQQYRRDDLEKVFLTGHSLGGGLAEYVQRFISNSEAITFDTSPNQGRLYSLFQEKKVKNVVRVYERGEILSYLRYVMSPDLSFEEEPSGSGVRAIWFDFNDENIIRAHSMRDLAINLIKVSASEDNQEAIEVINEVNARRNVWGLKPFDCADDIQRELILSQ